MALGYSIAFRSFVYTFPYGRAKTIQIRYVWTHVIFLTTQKKNLSFPNYGYVWTGPKKTGLMQAP